MVTNINSADEKESEQESSEIVFVLDIDESKFSEERLRYMIEKLQKVDQSKIVSVQDMAILLTSLSESFGKNKEGELLVYKMLRYI